MAALVCAFTAWPPGGFAATLTTFATYSADSRRSGGGSAASFATHPPLTTFATYSATWPQTGGQRDFIAPRHPARTIASPAARAPSA